MNSWIRIFLFVLLSDSFSYTAAQDCTSTLIINSDLADASIFIDDSLVARGKDFQAEVSLGTYVIRVIEDFRKWNSKSFTDTIEVKECSEVILNYVFNKEIFLDSDPQNAYVFLNDSLIGYTPLLINPDSESLVLQKQNYKNKIISLTDLNPDEKIKLDFTGEQKQESFYESTIFKLLAGTAIALGATTAYFKIKADNRFEEYKITGDQELLAQTDKFDLISGISFVALQINFGLIIYLFLSD